MMFIIQPDLHPGRCQNYRSHIHSDGHLESLRCLEYEAEEHVCQFPSPAHVPIDLSMQSYQYTTPKPVPWVKPTP